MKLKKWNVLSETDISPDKWFPLFRHKVQLPNGKIMDDYFISKLGDVAMIIPITKNEKIIFVKQYKHGIQEITLEFPAGIIEPGQTPEEAAFAELEQETGVIAKNMTALGELRTLPSKNFAKLFGFLTLDAEITTEQKPDVSEEIEVIELTKEEVNEKIISGEINCSDTIALYHLFLLKSKVRKTL
jgi:ADP-ribose pyrophosphatase